MNMKVTMLVSAVSAVLGALLALILHTSLGAKQPAASSDLVNKLNRLEASLEEERAARLEMESALLLSYQAQTSQESESELISEPGETSEELTVQNSLDTVDTIEEFESAPQPSVRDVRRQSLVAGGFSEEEADWVLSQEEQSQLDDLFNQHSLQRAALAEDSAWGRAWQQNRSRQDPLREKLGDEVYERYLHANGRPTSAEVGSVVRGSPAELAGLQEGDKIRSYAGERVYSMRDVSWLTLQGDEGDQVLLEVERNGDILQLPIPRGPVGVSSGSRRFRR